MRRIVVVVVVLVASCTRSDSELTRRVDQLEQEVAALKDATTQVAKDEEVLRSVFTGQFADVTERLYRAGITDEKNKNITHWWCIGDGACLRTEDQCTRLRARLAVERPSDMPELPACWPTRVAFCGGVLGENCYGRRELCVRVSTGRYAGPCLGTE